ncbi:MAG: hypothetical protein H7A23_03390 [Leptospiraceae bacterium]|nr:hypothetical protein [Leptospiraceae bacterium]
MKVFKQLIYTLVFITVVAGCTPNAISFNNNDDKKKDKNNQLLLGLFVLSQDQAVTTYTGSMNNSQYGHTATLLNNGKVLIVGDGAELYDPKKDKFESIDSRTKKRYLHKAILLKNGKVLICDGFSNFKFTIFDNSVELYNPDTNTFSQAGNMNEQRRNFSATLLNSGKVLLMGGYDLDFKVLSSAELYNPDINIFSTTGSLKKTRFFFGRFFCFIKRWKCINWNKFFW